MPELDGAWIDETETGFAEAVDRVEAELRSLQLPRPIETRPGRRVRPGIGIAAATLILAGTFVAKGHLPPF